MRSLSSGKVGGNRLDNALGQRLLRQPAAAARLEQRLRGLPMRLGRAPARILFVKTYAVHGSSFFLSRIDCPDAEKRPFRCYFDYIVYPIHCQEKFGKRMNVHFISPVWPFMAIQIAPNVKPC